MGCQGILAGWLACSTREQGIFSGNTTQDQFMDNFGFFKTTIRIKTCKKRDVQVQTAYVRNHKNRVLPYDP